MTGYVTIKVTAERLQVHPNTVRNWIKTGYMKADRLPSGHKRILESEVERLERLIQNPEGST